MALNKNTTEPNICMMCSKEFYDLHACTDSIALFNNDYCPTCFKSEDEAWNTKQDSDVDEGGYWSIGMSGKPVFWRD
jgi:hypothetical protein